MAQKRQGIISAIVFILGLLLILGPVYLFPVCQYKGMMIELKNGGLMPMKCSYTARAEIVLAVLTISIGIFLQARQSGSRRLLYGLLLIIAILVILVPTWLIGVCMSPTMPCRAGTLPFLELIGGLLIAVSVFGLVSER